MEIFQLILEYGAAILVLLADLFLLWCVIKKHPKTETLSFAAFLWWGILDLINAGASFGNGQPVMLPMAFGIGSLVVALGLAFNKQFNWTWFESLTSVAVVVCVVIWFYTGPNTAFWASIASLLIASLPQIIEAYDKPELFIKEPWPLYWLACVMITLVVWMKGGNFQDLVFSSLGIVTLGLINYFLYFNKKKILAA